MAEYGEQVATFNEVKKRMRESAVKDAWFHTIMAPLWLVLVIGNVVFASQAENLFVWIAHTVASALSGYFLGGHGYNAVADWKHVKKIDGINL